MCPTTHEVPQLHASLRKSDATCILHAYTRQVLISQIKQVFSNCNHNLCIAMSLGISFCFTRLLSVITNVHLTMQIQIHKIICSMFLSFEIETKYLSLVIFVFGDICLCSFVWALPAKEQQCSMDFNQELTRGMKTILCSSILSSTQLNQECLLHIRADRHCFHTVINNHWDYHHRKKLAGNKHIKSLSGFVYLYTVFHSTFSYQKSTN